MLVCLFELMLNAPFNSYVQAETLPPIHEAFIQNKDAMASKTFFNYTQSNLYRNNDLFVMLYK